MVMKTSRTKNAETGVTSSEAWQECVSKGWDYDSLHGSLEDWDSWIHSPLILFTLIKLGIESSGDSAASENLYGIEKESTQLLRWRASWNRYLTFVGAWHVAGVRGAQIFQLFHTCLGIPKPYLIWPSFGRQGERRFTSKMLSWSVLSKVNCWATMKVKVTRDQMKLNWISCEHLILKNSRLIFGRLTLTSFLDSY